MATTFRRLDTQLFSFDYADMGDFFKLPYDDSIFVKLSEISSSIGSCNAYNFTEHAAVYFRDSEEVVLLDAVIDLKERMGEGR